MLIVKGRNTVHYNLSTFLSLSLQMLQNKHAVQQQWSLSLEWIYEFSQMEPKHLPGWIIMYFWKGGDIVTKCFEDVILIIQKFSND